MKTVQTTTDAEGARSLHAVVRRYSRSNPECFEGEWWHWSGRMYAPIQMVHGTIQMHCMAHRAVRAWREFKRVTGKTKAQLMADGYRVKAILLVPGWKIKAPNVPVSDSFGGRA